MPDLFKIVFIFSVSFITTFLIFPKLDFIASKIDLLDYPNKRKVHIHPKPLIGGLGIIAASEIRWGSFVRSENRFEKMFFGKDRGSLCHGPSRGHIR